MSILAWMVLGLVGGLVAGWVWRSRGRALAGDAVVALLGAMLGGFIATVTLGLDITGVEPGSLLVAALGGALLLLVLHSLPATDVFD